MHVYIIDDRECPKYVIQFILPRDKCQHLGDYFRPIQVLLPFLSITRKTAGRKELRSILTTRTVTREVQRVAEDQLQVEPKAGPQLLKVAL
jgi:hypothetical protein